jgi:predicted RNase H-like HicB family nuclease
MPSYSRLELKGRPMRYTVILEEGREQGFVALCPALPGCISQGRTQAEALACIREAIEAYIEALREDSLPVPSAHCLDIVDLSEPSAQDPSLPKDPAESTDRKLLVERHGTSHGTGREILA